MRQASQSSWVRSSIFERRNTETEKTKVKENIVERKSLPKVLSNEPYVRLEKGKGGILREKRQKGEKYG